MFAGFPNSFWRAEKYLQGKNLGLILRIFFLAALIKDGANKETVFEPLKPIGDYSYYIYVRRNFRSRYRQEKEKQCLVRETNVQCSGQQYIVLINQKVSHLRIACLDE